MISVLQNGAVGDGITDDTAAIQECLNSGDSVYFPNGNYLISSPLQINYDNIMLVGDGWNTNILSQENIDIINITPNSPTTGGLKLKDLKMSGNIKNGITINLTNTNAFLKNAVFEHIFIDICTEKSIKLINPINSDGYFCSTIKDCVLYGEINLERAGDSLHIERNVISGNGKGIVVTYAVGAAQTNISKNNITCLQDPIIIGDGACLVTIEKNQIERWRPGSTEIEYTIQVGSVNYRANQVKIIDNNINSFGLSAAAILTGYADNTYINGNITNNSNVSVYIPQISYKTYIGINNNFSSPVLNQSVSTIYQN